MKVGEEIVTYMGGLIGLAVILRYSDNVNVILKQSFSGVSSFATTLLNPGAAGVMVSNTGYGGRAPY
jgi:hypothetical protein